VTNFVTFPGVNGAGNNRHAFRTHLRDRLTCAGHFEEMKWLWGLVFIASATSFAAIVGEDDRKEWADVTNLALKELGRATAVMVPKKVKWVTHAEQDNLCSGEPFADQPAPGVCSAFLVASDVLATAGHCVPDGCREYDFVFDFVKGTSSFDPNQVYECDRVLEIDREKDWALVKLDRATESRKPFKLREAEQPGVGTPLGILGYPRGIPLKIAEGASIVESLHSDEEAYFEAHFDAFGGNSGSPVVNIKTNELEGIYTVGFGELDDDTDPVTGKACRRLARRTESEATPGWATRVSNFREAVKKWSAR